ncbi:cell wall-active antibiotic response 4TMS protein YvqF [Nocardiopsis sp. Huas11]|nr:cell wall-active antibiotic response 4TMS protein YvqF [Nocardiopsis sp. Huas11]
MWSDVSEEPSPARLRASDSDRERVLKVLRDATADGRLDLDEFEERSALVQEARTLGELPGVTADLVPADRQPIRLDPQPVIGLFSRVARRGRWVAMPGEMIAAVFGRVDVDMREALLLRNHHRVVVHAFLGRVEIDVPEGVEVRMTGWSFLGRRSTNAQRSELPTPPVVEIDGFSVFGVVRVRAPRRRRFLGLVRRRPQRGITS